VLASWRVDLEQCLNYIVSNGFLPDFLVKRIKSNNVTDKFTHFLQHVLKRGTVC